MRVVLGMRASLVRGIRKSDARIFDLVRAAQQAAETRELSARQATREICAATRARSNGASQGQ